MTKFPRSAKRDLEDEVNAMKKRKNNSHQEKRKRNISQIGNFSSFQHPIFLQNQPSQFEFPRQFHMTQNIPTPQPSPPLFPQFQNFSFYNGFTPNMHTCQYQPQIIQQQPACQNQNIPILDKKPKIPRAPRSNSSNQDDHKVCQNSQIETVLPQSQPVFDPFLNVDESKMFELFPCQFDECDVFSDLF